MPMGLAEFLELASYAVTVFGLPYAVWVFWLDVIYLCAFSAYYYLATHPDTLMKVERMVQ